MAEGEWGSQNEEQDFGFDTEGVAPEDLGGGEIVNKEGTYHFEITDVKDDLDILNKDGKQRSPCIVVHLLVLESVKGQSPAGSRLFHRIFMASKGGGPISEGAKKSALRFGCGAGVIKAVEKDGVLTFIDPATNSTKIGKGTFHRMKGKQVIAKVAFEKSDNPKFEDAYKIQFGRCYDPCDPYVSEVPKNKEALEMGGYKLTPANQEKKEPPAAPPKQPPPPAKSDDDEFGDL